MFLSLSVRLLVNAEALNMVESIGNVIRHRRAPITIPGEKGEYILTYVPVVSGECLAHAYQSWIAEISRQRDLPVCEYCGERIFVKHGALQLFGRQPWEQELAKKIGDRRTRYDPQDIELEIIRNCVVEDIGGFLMPERIPVKRTAKFQVGYMIPAYEQIKEAALEAQFHVRYAPTEEQHAIYYVELGSALYTFQFNLDVDGIAYTSMLGKKPIIEDEDKFKGEKINRIRVALEALTQMMENRLFGAKLTRFNPVIDIRSLVVTISDPLPFTVNTGSGRSYLEKTALRMKGFSNMIDEEIKGWFVDEEDIGFEGIKEEKISLSKVNTVSEALREALSVILSE